MAKKAQLVYLRNLPETSDKVTEWADKEATILAQIENLELALSAVRTRGHDAAKTSWTKEEIVVAKATA